jgi:hypothetical protein
MKYRLAVQSVTAISADRIVDALESFLVEHHDNFHITICNDASLQQIGSISFQYHENIDRQSHKPKVI